MEEQGEEEVTVEQLVSQLADEKKQREKIAGDYKSVEAERNTLRDSLVKTRGAIEGSGVGKFNDNWDLQLDVAGREVNRQKVDPIDEQIKALEKRYDDGEIETKQYTNEISELKARKIFDQEITKRDQRNAETSASQTLQSQQSKILQVLDGKLPDHNNKNSALFAEMTKIVNENPDIYAGVDLTDMNNIKLRAVLAQSASMRIKGVDSDSGREQRQIEAGFDTINTGYTPSDNTPTGLNPNEKTMVVGLGFNAKIVKDLDSKFKNYEKQGGKVYIES